MATIYKRFGLLPVYRSDQIADWQKDGYYYNWQLAKRYVPRDVLVSFRSPLVNGDYTTPSTMTIRKLIIKGGIKEIIEQNDFNSDLIKYSAGSGQYYYYRQQGQFSANTDDYLIAGCVYDILFKDSNNNEFVTDIFIAVEDEAQILGTESGFGLGTEDGFFIGLG